MNTWDSYALVVIDIQRDFWPQEMATQAPGFPAAVTRTLDFCRTRGIDVIHVHSRFSPDESDWMRRYKLRHYTPCIDGTPGVEVEPFATPAPGELVLEKKTFDAFLSTDLHTRLQAAGKQALLITGLITSTCVLFTASSATQLGYLVTVVEDACADDELVHKRVLDQYPYVFSRTSSTTLEQDAPAWQEQIHALAVAEQASDR